jgi:hypothetical protein
MEMTHKGKITRAREVKAHSKARTQVVKSFRQMKQTIGAFRQQAP